jgi:hypothetical protein
LPATPSNSRPTAKKQQTGAQKTINQLLTIDLTAGNNNDNDNNGKGSKDSKGTKKTQDEIVVINLSVD